MNTEQEPRKNIPEKDNSKKKTLHELLKQGGGQNINIDFSMLSKKGTLSGLIKKAKQYQTLTNPTQNIINNDQKLEDEKKISTSNKKATNYELLNNYSKRLEQKNLNFKNETMEKDSYKQNKDGLTDKDDTEETTNTCHEIEYNNDNNNNNLNINNYNNINNNNYNINIKNRHGSKLSTNNNIINEKNINDEVNIYNNKQIPKNKHVQFDLGNNPNKKQLRFSYCYSNQTYNNNHSNFLSNKGLLTNSLSNIQNQQNINNTTRKKFKIKKNSINANEYETVKENYCIKHCNTVLEYSFREDQNIDSEEVMEDKSKSIENFNNDINQMLFEIFDGHGGDEMSTYLQNNFAHIYKQNLLLNKGNIIKSMKNSFLDADDEMKNVLNIEGLGSTGTIVHIIWENPEDLVVYCGNVGDSRCTLISPEHIIRLSYDHRVNDEKENKRIKDAKVKIIDNRINGCLMLTRIFGNYEFKGEEENEENENENENNGVICEPFISKINIDLGFENQFLILASDGVWDIMSEEEIQEIIINNNDSQQICAMIIKSCLRKEAWDNLSVFAIKLT